MHADYLKYFEKHNCSLMLIEFKRKSKQKLDGKKKTYQSLHTFLLQYR